MRGDPSWLAGYYAALRAPDAICSAIVPPDDYTNAQRTDFVSGYMVGARDQRNNALIEELQRGLE